MSGGAIARVPVRIASRRETDPGRTTAQRFIERRAFDAAHAIVVNADAIRRDLTAHGVRDGKIHTIYNGVDMRRLAAPPSMSRTDAIASFGIPVEGSTAPRLFVTILANLRLAIKDHPTFLRAAAQVHQTVPEAGFVVAGEGELVEPMRQLAAELGIADRTYFIGPCQRVPELLSFSDVCVLSSLSEGFPNVIVEYMASGHPVVSTDVGGAAEAIIEGRTGHLVKPGDALAMADRIISLLRDAERRAIFGAVGRLVALEKFSCASQLQRTDALYQRLLSGRPAVAPASRPTPHQQAAAAATDEV
jgi:glycosyltransferase involved in cell wall biosynthesis